MEQPDILTNLEIREANLSIEDMLGACIGANDDGTPKCALTLVNQRYYVEDVEKEPLEDAAYPCHNSIVSIQSRGEYVNVSLEFPSSKDIDFRALWEQVQLYGRDMDNVSDDDETIPALMLVVTPTLYKGKYYIVFANPIFWCIQPDKPDGELKCLSLLYELDDMNFFENDDAVEEYDEMERTVDQEVEAEIAWQQEREEKQREKEEWERHRSERYEEMRRNGEIPN